MIITTVSVQRPLGTTIATGVPVQIEQANAMERVELEGARPFDVFNIYTLRGAPTVNIRRRDVLVDENNLDEETGALAQYRVVGQVESYGLGGAWEDHLEILAERVVGS